MTTRMRFVEHAAEHERYAPHAFGHQPHRSSRRSRHQAAVQHRGPEEDDPVNGSNMLTHPRLRQAQLAAQAVWRFSPPVVKARVTVAAWLRAPAQILDPQPQVVWNRAAGYELRFPRHTPLPQTKQRMAAASPHYNGAQTQ